VSGKREVINTMAAEYPVRLLCELLGCAPTSYYYRSEGRDDTELRELIEQIALEFPCYGYRRITVEVRRRAAVSDRTGFRNPVE